MGVYEVGWVADCGHCQASVSAYPSIFWAPARGRSCPKEGIASAGALMLCNMGNSEGTDRSDGKRPRKE